MHTLLDTLAQLKVPYRPFVDPLDLRDAWWFMLIPMALGIAIVYKAVRVKETVPAVNGKEPAGWWVRYLLAVGIMAVQIVVGMAALAAASYLLVEVFARHVAERAGG